MTTIVLATANPDKVEELSTPLRLNGFNIKLQTDFFTEQVVEDGLSFIENALKKARFASAKTGLPAIADDSGLQVDALNGRPGIFSARFAETLGLGESSEEENTRQLVKALEGLPLRNRKANYICVVVYVAHENDETPLIGIGAWHGDILTEPRTQYGIGYDPVMWIPSELKAASEVPLERKLKISHRAQAMESVIKQIKQREAK
ncbi:RdgB/HAM1 family non-canonical purine NTP pyrophosphatase [Thiomicrorhabdus sp. Kp2]|uniref:RdgB/HAM1 family non-canonical purine NTP pyrophosphatase n=1 Tax=Thiomicrorhabdus sp. Kp2 TaxID=1123518 RepID=UPI0004247323|nr:RdgB/HAM1 family non-canonical purine NTP pyrophosphatase [Thiomicrorhabdus sp. Kp2]